jgi:hypothetical protein
MITDLGLDLMGGTTDWMRFCQVGTGSATPSAADTALSAYKAGTQDLQSFTESGSLVSPFFCARTQRFRFAAGQATGNLTEVGVSTRVATGNLSSRALILDNVGNPTSITVLADEVLDVTYQFRQYVPEVDSTGNITLDGVVYAYVARAANADSQSTTEGWSIATGGQAGTTVGASFRQTAHSGAIGLLTDEPAGTTSEGTATSLAYLPGSYQAEWSLAFGVNNGNFAGGIGAIRSRCGIGTYQFGFTPNIAKDLNKTLSLTFRHSWSRRP